MDDFNRKSEVETSSKNLSILSIDRDLIGPSVEGLPDDDFLVQPDYSSVDQEITTSNKKKRNFNLFSDKKGYFNKWDKSYSLFSLPKTSNLTRGHLARMILGPLFDLDFLEHPVEISIHSSHLGSVFFHGPGPINANTKEKIPLSFANSGPGPTRISWSLPKHRQGQSLEVLLAGRAESDFVQSPSGTSNLFNLSKLLKD